jgi:catechol 2,3-dioxygenase-like lactoylglutathione lyase family enzyme
MYKMKKIFIIAGMMSLWGVGYLSCAFLVQRSERKKENMNRFLDQEEVNALNLGAFSVSLAVKDINVSRIFYENVGFSVLGGAMEKKYLIMKNGNCLIGLFQGMFEENILTFNPGWDENGSDLEIFDDVRVIQKHLKSKGIQLSAEVDEKTSGPASVLFQDPDGNTVLLDQHR